MPSTATVTGTAGPGTTVTAQVFSNVTYFTLTTDVEMLELSYDNGSGRRTASISIAAATTLTLTVSGNAYTLTIS